MDCKKIIPWLKMLYKVLPLIISAIGGGAAVAAVSGCKCGSVVSFVSPAI